jgi:hypothetical protein
MKYNNYMICFLHWNKRGISWCTLDINNTSLLSYYVTMFLPIIYEFHQTMHSCIHLISHAFTLWVLLYNCCWSVIYVSYTNKICAYHPFTLSYELSYICLFHTYFSFLLFFTLVVSLFILVNFFSSWNKGINGVCC